MSSPSPKLYRCNIEVRGYELDSFGHVNHATYISYLEHARWKLLEEESIGLPELKRWGKWPVIAKLEVSYLKPTYLCEKLLVETRLQQRGRTSFLAHQTISRDGVPVLTAQVHVVIVNDAGRPSELPEEVRKLAEEVAPAAPQKTET